MLGADVPVAQPFCLFSGISEDALAFVAQRKIDRRGNFLPDGSVPFNLLADGFDRSMRAQKTVGQSLVFAQQPQQQMLRLNVRRTELAGLVPREENYTPRLFCVPLKHVPLTQMLPVTSAGQHLSLPPVRSSVLPGRSLSVGPRAFQTQSLREADKNHNVLSPSSKSATTRATPPLPCLDVATSPGHSAGQNQGCG